MSLATNIVRRGAIYYVRVAVPKDIRMAFGGRKEIWKTLRTPDCSEARKRALAVLDDIYADFDGARRRKEPTEADLQAAVWEFYQERLKTDLDDRKSWVPSGHDLNALGMRIEDLRRIQRPGDEKVVRELELDLNDKSERALELRKENLEREQGLRGDLANGETFMIEWAADKVIAERGFDIPMSVVDDHGIERLTPAYRDLCQRLLRAELEAVKRWQERDNGHFDGQPTDELIKPPSSASANSEAMPGESIMELYERYARDSAEKIKPDTLDQNRKIVRLFAEFVGLRASVSAIDQKAVREWKEKLFLWPRKAAEISEFKGMDFRSVIEKNRSVGRTTIVNKTLNKYLSALGGFCRWLRSHGYISENPVDGMQIALDKSKKKVFPYSTEQLKDIFSSPLYTGCFSEKKMHEPGDLRIRDHRYWLPLIGLFSGARLGEGCQLLVKDIVEQEGVWVFSITTEDDEAKSLKTPNAKRIVPLHPELLKLGLLQYRDEQECAGASRLFSEIKPNSLGRLSGRVTDWYRRYAQKIGVKVDKKVNFHSFRHGFVDELRRAGYQDIEFQDLIGHAKSTVTSRYGVLSDLPLQRRMEMVSAVRYPGLDLSTLYV